MRNVLIILFSLLAATLLGCSSSSGGDSSSAEGDTSGVSSGDVSFTTLCGVARVERLVNPITEGLNVSVEVIDSDLLIVRQISGDELGDPQLVKLHAVTSAGVNVFRVRNGIALMQERLASGGVFVPAGTDCGVVVEGGGAGVLGQVFSPAGESMTELMLQQGAVLPVTDICDGDQLASCYSTIGVLSRPPSDIELDLVDVSLSSQCGAVRDNVVINPVAAAEEVAVGVNSIEEVVITRFRGIEAGNSQAVKLQGVSSAGVPAFRQALGRALVEAETAAGAYFLSASQTCEASFPGGGRGVFGQLYSLSGLSLNEELIRTGSAVPASDPCGGELLLGCYASIEVTAPNPGNEPPSDLVIDNFLWKPISEGDGNLVILVNPVGVTVVVSGAVTQNLVDFGPSNDRGTTARADRPGCGFGDNVRVEFFDAAGNRVFIANGDDAVIVPRGCDRFEFRL